MSFHLSAWSIKNPVPTIVAFLVMGIVGVFCFLTLGIDNNPNIDIPLVSVSVTQQGAGPEELESQITKKVEDAIAGLDNIDNITSTITDGRSETQIEFLLGTDSDRATNDVRNAISQIRQDLPDDINEPIVQRVDFAGGAIITYAVASEGRSVEELSDILDRQIARRLLNVAGVAQINRLGGLNREIRIDLDPARLQAYGITATQVNDQIRDFNINLPGGRAEVGGSEQNVRTLGSAKTVAELRNYSIVLPNGDTVPLLNFGRVEDSHGEARQSAFLNDKPVVAFSVQRSTGSTLVTVEEGVKKAIAELEQALPADIELSLIFSQADNIRDSYKGTIDALWIGCVLTIISVGLFLREWRPTLITAVALPLSVIPTFFVMKFLNYTLNGMTLLALALALGNLVDDAICMIENIDQHLQMGKKPFQAALDAAREIGLAVVATTATIVAVFLPVAFMGGIPGQFFQPFGVTVAVSTMFSTLVATTVTPLLSAYLLKPKAGRAVSEQSGGCCRGATDPRKRIWPYRSLLKWSLRHRLTTLLIALALFIGSLQLVPFIPTGLFDSGDRGISLVSVEMPPGTPLKDTEATISRISQLLLTQPEVASTLGTIGQEKINTALIYANLIPKAERELSQREFEQRMRERFREIPGARISFRGQGAGGSDKDVSIVLKSDNPESLVQAAIALETQMRDLPGLVDVTSSVSLVKPELIVEPIADRAGDLGVSVEAIARTASLALIGDNEFALAKFNLPDRQIPIRVQIDPRHRKDLETVKNLWVPARDGTLVPLSAVATLRLGSGPAEINRFNRNRQVSLEANLQELSLGQAIERIRALPAFRA
ncbi:MAG: efflux RND transporter permease subunit, partial [Chloroflexaceae bacterium]|nr:efflux RND transporter permease subunit [Chloroflexaceae bacterium]